MFCFIFTRKLDEPDGNVIKDNTYEDNAGGSDSSLLVKLIVCIIIGAFTIVMAGIAYFIWKSNKEKVDEKPDIEMVKMSSEAKTSPSGEYAGGNEVALTTGDKYVKMEEDGEPESNAETKVQETGLFEQTGKSIS